MSKCTRWLSRDSKGEYEDEIFVSKKNPSSSGGAFSDEYNIDNFNVDCESFERFCRMFNINIPQKGESVKITINAIVDTKLSSLTDLIVRIKKAKKFDKSLMKEVVGWLEYNNDDVVMKDQLR